MASLIPKEIYVNYNGERDFKNLFLSPVNVRYVTRLLQNKIGCDEEYAHDKIREWSNEIYKYNYAHEEGRRVLSDINTNFMIEYGRQRVSNAQDDYDFVKNLTIDRKRERNNRFRKYESRKFEPKDYNLKVCYSAMPKTDLQQGMQYLGVDDIRSLPVRNTSNYVALGPNELTYRAKKTKEENRRRHKRNHDPDTSYITWHDQLVNREPKDNLHSYRELIKHKSNFWRG